MSKKFDVAEFNDPIARQQRIREDENFREDLFLPIMVDGPKWDIDWLVEGLIPKSYLVMLAAPPKSGKTCFATALALAVAAGVPFAGRQTNQCAVLWIAGEENPYERNLFLKGSPLADPSVPLWTCHQPFQIDDEYYLTALQHWVHETGAGLIVVDPLLGSVTGRSLRDSWAARKTLKTFKQFCHHHRLTGLVLHHSKRDDQARRHARVADNDQLSATASMNIVLSSRRAEVEEPRGTQKLVSGWGGPPQVPGFEEETDAPRLVTLQCDGRGAWANGTVHLLSRGPLDFRPTDGKATVIKEKSLTYGEQTVLDMLKEGEADAATIIESTNLAESTVRNSVTNLRRKGLIFVTQVQSQRRIYRLCDQPQKARNPQNPGNPENLEKGSVDTSGTEGKGGLGTNEKGPPEVEPNSMMSAAISVRGERTSKAEH